MSTQSAPVIDVGPHNVDDKGFFCLMSRRKAEGYRRKRDWLISRFEEGMRLRMFELPNRGFIEYLPGEYAWRPVEAKGFLFIHCLWIVGKSKGNGLARRLIDDCLADAKANGFRGVAMVTSEKVWLVEKSFLEKNGFVIADSAESVFHLMVRSFDDGPLPHFVDDIERRAEQYSDGLTVFRSDQCPYIEDAVTIVRNVAEERGIRISVVALESSADIREKAVSVFGLFSIVYRGQLLSYHYLTEKQLQKRLDDLDADLG